MPAISRSTRTFSRRGSSSLGCRDPRRHLVLGQPRRSCRTDSRGADTRRLQLVLRRLSPGRFETLRRIARRYPGVARVDPLSFDELGIDPARLILLGEDSGAQLVAMLAAQRIPGVIGAVLVGGFYDLTATPGTTEENDVALLARASPTTHVVSKMPPLLLVHGSADGEAPIEQAQRYCRAVVQAEGHCRLLEVEGASHRSENWWPSQWDYKREIVTWLSTLAPVPSGGQPRHPGTALLKDIVYSESQRLKLDAFIPPARKPVPAIILVHGGGWEAGDKVTYVTPLFEPLARAGLAWFSIDYRLTPESTHRDQLEDLRQAIRFVRAEHARFNIDPTRVVLVGESASGHMVTQIAAEDAALAGVVSFYGVYDLPSMVTDTSPRSLLGTDCSAARFSTTRRGHCCGNTLP